MHCGGAGWLSIKQTDGNWAGELWAVGQPKEMRGIEYAEGRLTFTRNCKLSDFLATEN